MSDIITAYLQNQAIRAVIDISSEQYSLRNLPMYDNPLTVTKNVSTTIGLEVKRIDRKVLKIMPDKIFYLNVMSKDGEIFLLRKEFEVFNTQRGQLQITIEPEDIDVIETGMYTYSVSYIDSDTGQEKLLNITPNTTTTYSDFIIESNSMPVKRKPFIQYHLTKVRTVLDSGVPTDKDTYISSRLPIIKDIHNLILSFTNFSGTVKIQATNDIDPTDQVSFFDVQQFDYTEETGDTKYELVPNKDYKYYRIRIITTVLNEGSVDKLEYN